MHCKGLGMLLRKLIDKKRDREREREGEGARERTPQIKQDVLY